MDDERFDLLLARALASGTIPAAATAAERAEIEAALAATRAFGEMRATIDSEARDTMPVARARFERFVAGQRQPLSSGRPRLAPDARPWFFGRLFTGPAQSLTTVAVAAAIGLVAVVALVASQSLFDSGSSTALALQPGEYVQLTGTVTGDTAAGQVRLRSGAGDIVVELSEETVLAASAPKPGDSVLITGVVGKDRRVAAQSLTPVQAAPGPAPIPLTLQQLRNLRGNLAGLVVVLTISPDGKKGRIVLDSEGRRYVVTVDAQSTSELVERFSSVVGARVKVNAPTAGAGGNVFSLSIGEQPGDGPAARPGLVVVKGTIAQVDGRLLRVQTPQGPVVVGIRPLTRILVPESTTPVPAGSLEAVDIAAGQFVSVTGFADKATGRVVAELIVVGLPPGRRPAATPPAAR